MSFHFYRVCSWIANTDHLSIDSSCDNVERDLWAAVNIRVAAIETNWNPAAGRSTAIQRSPRYLGLLWRDLVSLAHIISEPIMAPSPRSFGESVIRFRGGRGPLFFARATKKNQSSSLSLSLSASAWIRSVRPSSARKNATVGLCFQRTLYTYVTSNESPPRTWNEIHALTCLSTFSILRFRFDKCPSFVLPTCACSLEHRSIPYFFFVFLPIAFYHRVDQIGRSSPRYFRSDVYSRSWRPIVNQYHATVPFIRACSTTNSLL